jgi:hypothetical protein
MDLFGNNGKKQQSQSAFFGRWYYRVIFLFMLYTDHMSPDSVNYLVCISGRENYAKKCVHTKGVVRELLVSNSPAFIRSDKKYIFVFSMPALNTILKELKDVPVDRLEDLYSIIHSLQENTKKSGKRSKQILSFAGSFNDMPENDYNDFLHQTKQARNDLFDRDINL